MMSWLEWANSSRWRPVAMIVVTVIGTWVFHVLRDEDGETVALAFALVVGWLSRSIDA